MTDPGTGGAPAGGPAAPAAPAAPTFTQEQLNAIAAREKDSGKKSGRSERDAELAAQFGVTVEELPARLEAWKTEADSRKSEAQRAKEAADAAKVAADKTASEAAALTHATRIERALIRAGVSLEADDKGEQPILDDAVRLLRVDPDADAKTIGDEIEKLKGRHPGMFAPQAKKPQFGAPPDVRPPSGRPGPPTDGRDPQVERQLRKRGYLKEVS